MSKSLKLWIIWVLIGMLVCSVGVPAFAEETDNEESTEDTNETPAQITPLPDEPYSDHLTDKTDVHWYSFEMKGQGKGVVRIQSLQKVWTGYTYYWYATVFASDRETVVAESSVRGADYLTTLNLGELSAGTYYLQIRSVAYNNPLMAGFTDESYEISTEKYYYFTERTYPENGVQILYSADELICKLGTTFFVKNNDGMAYVGLYRNDKGAIVPFLVGETKESVEYRVSDGTIVYAWDVPFEYNGKEYYYSYADSIQSYEYDSSTYPIYFSDSQSQACADVGEDILKQYDIFLAGGEFKYFMQHNWVWVTIVAVLGITIVIGAFKDTLPGGGGESRSRSSSSYTSYSSTSTSSASNEVDIIDMEIAKKIAGNINTPGYDPDSFGSGGETPPADPESFPPSGDIW